MVAHAEVEDEVGARGSGPVAFGSFAFRDDEPSVLVLPEVVLGRADGRTWLTTVGEPPRLASPEPVRGTRGLRYAHGELPVTEFRAAVAGRSPGSRAGELDKVVLAHDLLAVAERRHRRPRRPGRAGRAQPRLLDLRGRPVWSARPPSCW